MKCAWDLLCSNTFTTHMWMWAVGLQRLLYVMPAWVSGLWTRRSVRQPVGRQWNLSKAAGHCPAAECLHSSIEAPQTAESSLLTSCSSCSHRSALWTLRLLHVQSGLNCPKTHISGLQRPLGSCLGSEASPSYTQCFSFRSWRSEVLHTPKVL